MEEQKEPLSCHPTETKKKKTKNEAIKTFLNGIFSTNAVFALLLGLCPALAVSTSLDNAFGMSYAVLMVLLASNLMISAVRNWVPGMVRIPIYIVIIATFVTIVYVILQAYVPPLAKSLGIYVPLIVVNCIILGRAEAFASKNSVKNSFADAVGISFGFAGAILLIAFIRQILGTGSLSMFNINFFTVPGLSEYPMSIFILPMGAFLVIGVLLAAFRYTGVMKNE